MQIDAGFEGILERWDWTEAELDALIEKCLVTYCDQEEQDLFLFLDGVDESGEEETPNLIRYFRKLSTQTEGRLNICISCRPRSPGGAQYIVVEREELSINIEIENRHDIKTFLDGRFASVRNSGNAEVIGKITELETVKAGLLERATCVFQWIAWVTRPAGRVMKLLSRNEGAERILGVVEAYPTELADVYGDVIRHIDECDIALALRLFEWIMFAKRPLESEELRLAICLNEHERYESTDDLQRSEHYCRTEEQLLGRIEDFSSGLVRLQKKKAIHPVLSPLVSMHRWATVQKQLLNRESALVFQFDHDSVYEFMLHEGLQILEYRINGLTNLLSVAQKHLSMARRCLQYLHLKEIVSFDDFAGVVDLDQHGMTLDDMWFISIQGDQEWTLRVLPYAASTCFRHVAAADQGDVSMEALIRDFSRVPCWQFGVLHFTDTAVKMELVTPKTVPRIDCLLHMFSAYNLVKTLTVVLATEQPDKNLRDFQYRCRSLVQTVDHAGLTPLHLAAWFGYEAIVDLFLDVGANTATQCPNGFLPLHLATAKGYRNAVRSLMDRSIDSVDAQDNTGCSPLYVAVVADRFEVVRLLMPASKIGVHSDKAVVTDKDSPVRIWTPLFAAWLNGSVEMMRQLLECHLIDGTLQDSEGGHLLHQISYGLGDMEFRDATLLKQKTQLLISSGKFPLNARNRQGLTPVAYAAAAGNMHNLEALMGTAEVDMNIKDDSNMSPCMLAVVEGRANAVELLIRNNKVDYDTKFENRSNLLQIAVAHGKADVAKLLLDTGKFDVSETGPDGWTLLHLAVYANCAEAVGMILDDGKLDPNIRCKDDTPLQFACTQGYTDVIETLASSDRVNMEVKGKEGGTVLLEAVSSGQVEVVRTLLRIGRPDVNIPGPGPKHIRPHMAAVGHSRPEMMRLLLANGRIHEQRQKNGMVLVLAIAIGECEVEVVHEILDAIPMSVHESVQVEVSPEILSTMPLNVPLSFHLKRQRFSSALNQAVVGLMQGRGGWGDQRRRQMLRYLFIYALRRAQHIRRLHQELVRRGNTH